MKYTLEEIYALVGKQDKTATVSFRYNSVSYKLYGQYVTIVFVYTQKEREELDMILDLKEHFSRNGYLKAKYLGRDLPEELIRKILIEGINSEDITEILFFKHSEKNTFHSIEKRTIETINIPITLQEDFKNTMQSFNRTYSFLTQIMPFSDVDLEKLFTYTRFLYKKLPRTSQNDKFKLGDEVSLEYYRL